MDSLVLQSLNRIADQDGADLAEFVALIKTCGEAESEILLDAALTQIRARLDVYRVARSASQPVRAIDNAHEFAAQVERERTPQPYLVIGLYLDNDQPQRFADQVLALSPGAAEAAVQVQNPLVTVAAVVDADGAVVDDDPALSGADPASAAASDSPSAQDDALDPDEARAQAVANAGAAVTDALRELLRLVEFDDIAAGEVVHECWKAARL